MEHERLGRLNDRVKATLAFYDADDPDLSPIDQILKLPKDVIYRLSFEALVAELPETAAVFQECSAAEVPVTESGRMLQTYIRDAGLES